MRNKVILILLSTLLTVSVIGNIALFNSNKSLQKSIDVNVSEVENLQNTINEKTIALESAESRNSDLEATIEDLQSQIEDLKSSVSELTSINADLTEQLEKLQQEYAEVEKSKTEISVSSSNNANGVSNQPSESASQPSQPSQSEQQRLEDALASLGWTGSDDVIIGSGTTGEVSVGMGGAQ